ncbi:hypothetical protein L218DRAFT_768806 [Marasmius fiardii PR-910]|nr:hypothetical protein L218DRAFT_768806 [Marasmius fiardii PR-910]
MVPSHYSKFPWLWSSIRITTRWRAQINPKCFASEHGQGKKSQKGLPGLYKGLVPRALSLAVPLALWSIFGVEPLVFPETISPECGGSGVSPMHVSYWFLQLAIDIPTHVILYRAITTPYRLTLMSPLKSLFLLFSPSERRNPLNLYRIYGLTLTRSIIYALSIIAEPIGPPRRLNLALNDC